MTRAADIIEDLRTDIQEQFKEQHVILGYGEFLDMLESRPSQMIRCAAEYLRDTFDYFGKETIDSPAGPSVRFKLFNEGSDRNGPIIGSEAAQEEIYKIIDSFVRQGRSNKLILLHGPNGSAKSSTIESISAAMHRYSETPEGSVYSFNWIFPADKTANPSSGGEGGPIGFGSSDYEERSERWRESYAHLEEAKIACKIHSEFRDNPVYLLPMPQREKLLRRWLATEKNCAEADVEVPYLMLQSGLSKKNQLIFENLLAAYQGDLAKVLRHVQVERFFYSRAYRVGIATVEPQMSIDANERQLTMDKNIMNLPVFLNNIRFHEASGQLVEANRGILEFSDMLKRPVEAFKYLLTTVEKTTLSLPSSTVNLDVVFFATTNEKHLDAFKTLPDFSSFRSRFELVTVPYLLDAKKEQRIYASDVHALSKSHDIAPHTLYSLCLWAVMTRYKQPDPEHYESKYRALVARLDPRSKAALYEGDTLQPAFKSSEEIILRDMRQKIYAESLGVAIYEGRFGASPREIRVILHRAAQNSKTRTLLPMAIFSELRKLVRDKTVYEFLQFEPRGKYHDAEKFIEIVEEDFAAKFDRESLRSMALVEEFQYDVHLQRYIDNVVAFLKKEKIYVSSTGSYEDPDANLMKDFEKIIGVTGSVERYRQGLLSRIAATKLENPTKNIDVKQIFEDLLAKIQEHYHEGHRQTVDIVYKAMLTLDSDDRRTLTKEEIEQAETTYENLKARFGYNRDAARASLRFLLMMQKKGVNS